MSIFKRKKIEIRVSKLLVGIAMADASANALREEFYRQTMEQINGTWLQGASIEVHYGFDDHPTPKFTWTERPAADTRDLTFVWVD